MRRFEVSLLEARSHRLNGASAFSLFCLLTCFRGSGRKRFEDEFFFSGRWLWLGVGQNDDLLAV